MLIDCGEILINAKNTYCVEKRILRLQSSFYVNSKARKEVRINFLPIKIIKKSASQLIGSTFYIKSNR
jgi:hypothetical protein